jgi:hypothetical protein
MGGSRSSFERAWRSSARGGCVALVVACTRGGGESAYRAVDLVSVSPPKPDAALVPLLAPGDASSPAGDAGDDREGADPEASYASALPLAGKSVGHTSVVFKLTLAGGLVVAYKPRSAHGDHRYRGEIAAYRLARALALENVPLAMPRSFDYAAMLGAVGREPIFAEVVKEPDGEVRGALIPWIKGLEFIPLEGEEWMQKWRGWLRVGGAIPPDQRALAAQISDALAFDLVTGNWDRWSGGNVGIDRARGTLLFVDNDGAFFDPVPTKEMKRPTELFEGVERFSRSFVAALRAVDVGRAVGEEAPGEPLLSARVVAGAEARRKRVLAVIDAKVRRLGEEAVLAFE